MRPLVSTKWARYLFFDDELWSDFDRKVKSLPDWQARLDRLI